MLRLYLKIKYNIINVSLLENIIIINYINLMKIFGWKNCVY